MLIRRRGWTGAGRGVLTCTIGCASRYCVEMTFGWKERGTGYRGDADGYLEEAVEEGLVEDSQATKESNASRRVSPQQVFLGIFYIRTDENSHTLDGKESLFRGSRDPSTCLRLFSLLLPLSLLLSAGKTLISLLNISLHNGLLPTSPLLFTLLLYTANAQCG